MFGGGVKVRFADYLSASGSRVLLFVPNQVAYVRAALLCLFLLLVNTAPLVALCCYAVGALLDAVDGYLARRLHQQSRLGALLDFTLDRVAQAALVVVLIRCFPDRWLPLLAVLLLDLFSHLSHLYHTALSQVASHKLATQCSFRMLCRYYQQREILFFSCLFYELWLCALFIYSINPGVAMQVVLLLTLPGFLFKLYIHVLQAWNALRSSLNG